MNTDERLNRIDDTLADINKRLASMEGELKHIATKADVGQAKRYTFGSIAGAVVAVGAAAWKLVGSG